MVIKTFTMQKIYDGDDLFNREATVTEEHDVS